MTTWPIRLKWRKIRQHNLRASSVNGLTSARPKPYFLSCARAWDRTNLAITGTDRSRIIHLRVSIVKVTEQISSHSAFPQKPNVGTRTEPTDPTLPSSTCSCLLRVKCGRRAAGCIILRFPLTPISLYFEPLNSVLARIGLHMKA